MFKHYLKTFYRNLFKNKSYTWINIFGLSFSIAAIILLVLYLQFEFSFDKFHQNKDEIYRIAVRSFHEGVNEGETHVFVAPVGVDLKKDFPEVENYTRYSHPRKMFVIIDEQVRKVNRAIYADSTFFELFSFDVLAGDKQRFLQKPFSIVLTEKTANQLFGTTDVLGRTLLDNQKKAYTVTGIVREPPRNSSVQFDALVSFSTLYKNPDKYMGWNGGNQYITFIQLKKGISASQFSKKLPGFFWEHINKDLAQVNVKYEAYLQPLKDIHLKYDVGYNKIYFFGIIGLLIWFIAMFNFVNLSMAYYSKRSAAIAVRKTLGADRKAIMWQFLSETALLVFISIVLGMVLAYLLTPYYRNLMQADFYGIDFSRFSFWAILLGIWLLTSLLSGFYPAVYLSKLPVNKLFKNHVVHQKNHFSLQNSLIILQFMVAVSLVIFTLVIRQQLQYINHKDVGYQREQMLIIPLPNEEAGKKIALIKQKLRKISGIAGITASSDVPGNNFTSNGYFLEGFDTPAMIHVLNVDADFLKTYGIEIQKGRNFSEDYLSDKQAFLVNETLSKKYGDQLGKVIKRDGKHPVIGVVKDFNFASLRESIAPLIIAQNSSENSYEVLSVKLKTNDYQSLIKEIEKTWHRINPEWAFEYSFLDEQFEQVYRSDFNTMQLFTYFSILAILIATMGLFSLSALSIEQRRKEIGIRKVLGASIADIIRLISKKYLIMVLIANLLIWPVLYKLVSAWLETFANRIELSVSFFILGGLLSLLVALLSVGIKSVQIAVQNPVESLRYE